MDDTNAPMTKGPTGRPLLGIEMPRAISDEAALQIYELMRRLINAFDIMYGNQIRSAETDRHLAIKQFFNEQYSIRAERELRARQLDLNIPLPEHEDLDQGDEFDEEHPF